MDEFELTAQGMAFSEGDVLRLSRMHQASVLGEFESVWLDEGTPMTVVRVLGDQQAPSGYELEAFVLDRCRHVFLTVCAVEISDSLRGQAK
ncbi:hypothetical protein [Burkholderia ubonensis]|uniref:hypothetical protein n=1 Tax=Burkholderia ubonensis TaxID=101571 RepID=UPI000755A5CB|nr:hypothetical protein [Burkholderia ubonensis]KVO84766.1 hypothetical protein WJ82_16205 [Burkholderia ubonensis]